MMIKIQEKELEVLPLKCKSSLAQYLHPTMKLYTKAIINHLKLWNHKRRTS